MIKASQHNLTVIRNGIKKQLPQIEKQKINVIFSEAAHAAFEWIDAHSGFYLDDTYNLRDSIGVGVYKSGKLQQWIVQPPALASAPRRFKYGENIIFVNGRELLDAAISGGAESGIAEYALVLYAVAPYGVLVEDGGGKRGTGWWSEGLVPYVKERFLVTIAKYNAR